MGALWKRIAAAACVALGMTQAPTACLSAKVRDTASTSALIDKCTTEARAAYYVGGASVEESTRIYDACIADGGAR